MCCVIEWMDGQISCVISSTATIVNSNQIKTDTTATINDNNNNKKQRQIFELHAKSNLLKMFTGNFTLGTKILVDVNDGSCNDTE